MARTERLLILIIEDHDDSRDALQRLLELQGHVVRPAHSVAAALAVANAWPIDLVIGDIGLPDGDGCDLMRMLRETRRIPSIAISGYADDEHHQRAARAGICVHLFKPIAFEQLEAAIERCMPRA
jgi:CheY-like chemotaxis protein